ncbi:MAG: c-type cytochrome, partial [Sulfitobacter sp.]
MFDTMTVTKIAAGLFGAWLILLLGKFAAEEVYQRGAHGEPGYVVEVASAEASAPAE